MKRFSRWTSDADLHNQLNRLVSDVQNEFASIKPSTTATEITKETVVAPQQTGIGAASLGGASVVAGTGIAVTPVTGGSQISNTGALSLLAGSGITVSTPTGNITVSATAPSALRLFVPSVQPFVSSPYAIPASQNTFLAASADAGADFIADLPAATGAGITVVVKKMDANPHNIAVTPNGSDTIDGVNAADNIGTQYNSNSYFDLAAGQWAKF